MGTQELPEWARPTTDDLNAAAEAWLASAPIVIEPNQHYSAADKAGAEALLARVLARMPKPEVTDQPPEVTHEDAVFAEDAAYRAARDIGRVRAALEFDRKRLWKRYRPKPAEPVRFALEKVTDEVLWPALQAAYAELGREKAIQAFRCAVSAYAPPPAKGEPIAYITKAALKSWAKRASDDPQSHVFLSSGGELRVPLYASPQPPRKVEVTVEAVNAMFAVTDQGVIGKLETIPNFVEGLKAFLDVAHTQAAARESEAVAEVERLKGGIARLTEERDEAQALANLWREECARSGEATLRAHADKLERMLTTTGGVKLWEGFEYTNDDKEWVQGVFADCRINCGSSGIRLANYAKIRQTPAPTPEPLKRWKIANADEFTNDVEYFVSKPMTRADAEKRGKVIGEAE